MVKGSGPVRDNDYIKCKIDRNKINYLLRYIRENTCVCQLQLVTMNKLKAAVRTKKIFPINIPSEAGHKI